MRELFAEAYRLRLLCGLEELLFQAGYGAIAGVDEVGRGALAGPVVAAAVIPRQERLVPGVDDSKCLAAPEREALSAAILDASLAWAVAAVEPADIDRLNILEATRLAMRRALAGLAPAPDFAVIDAVGLPDLPWPHLPVVRGDAVCYAVACASIVAKVYRDRLMVDLDRRFPAYGFAAHKGYGVPEHLEALAAFGPSPLHRLTFHSVVPRTAAAAGRAARRRA
jgi:ribonuclease HII